MNGIFHLVAAIMLGLLVWWWTEEKAKNRLVVALLKQFTEHHTQTSGQPTGQTSMRIYHKLYLKNPLTFATTLCHCFGIPHEIDFKLKALCKPAKIDPVPLVGFVLFNQVQKMTCHIGPDQTPELLVWVVSNEPNPDQVQQLKAALGGKLEVAIVNQAKVSKKT